MPQLKQSPINFIPWINGNITPPKWYHKILKPSGTPDFVAIAILSDVMNWYQPTKDGKQKFKADKLQQSYQSYALILNVSKHMIKQSFDLLETQGLIKREFRTVETVSGLIMNNMMYISPMIDNIKFITIDTDTKNSPPPKVYGESPPKVYGESPPTEWGDKYGTNGNNFLHKNDSNEEIRFLKQEEVIPAVVFNIFKEENSQSSQQQENLSFAEYNKKKFESVVSLIPEKYEEPFVLSYLKKSIAEEDYTEEYYKNAILYVNDHAKGDAKQYRSYLGQTIDKQWAVNYVSKKTKEIEGKKDTQKKLEEKRNMPTGFLFEDAKKGCVISTQVLNERPIEQLKKEYEEDHCLSAKAVLIKRGILPKPEAKAPNLLIEKEDRRIPPLKTEKEKQANWERQKKALLQEFELN